MASSLIRCTIQNLQIKHRHVYTVQLVSRKGRLISDEKHFHEIMIIELANVKLADTIFYLLICDKDEDRRYKTQHTGGLAGNADVNGNL